jgi:small subunit ribosomal protein S13
MADPTNPENAQPPSPSEGKASEDFRYIVRIANTDLDGNRSVVVALTGVKGVGLRVAEAVADMAGVARSTKIGELPEERTEEIAAILENLAERLPPWMLNRQKDWDSGADLHLYGTDVDVRRRDDVNRLKMIRAYRGIRHELGQKVRGQRTRSNGRSGLTVGVMKKAAREAAKRGGK